MKPHPREEAIRYWWSKAEESLASARRELEAGSNSFAINRLYYAAFYAVSAALLARGHSFSKHSGVRAAFHRQFVKTAMLDPEWGRLYDQLYEDRQEGDYVVLSSFERDYVESRIDGCARFLAVLRPLVAPLS